MEENKSILHELYVFSEWKPEPEYIQKPDNILPENISALWRWLKFFGPKKSLIDSIAACKERQQKWHIALGDEGKVIAVLADNILEIRTKRSEYATIAARTTVSRDAYPQWRKLVWSPDCSFLAMAYGNGVVSFFDLTASNLFNIPADCTRPGGLECTDNTHAVADIIFMPLRVKDNKWNWEVLVVTYDGRIRGFLISVEGCELHHSFSFPGGAGAVVPCSARATLLLAGLPRAAVKDPSSPLSAGITAWRILNEAPWYKLSVVSDQLETQLANQGFQLYLPFVSTKNLAFIVQMVVSPDNSKLVCVHCNGDVTVWRLPLLRLLHRHPLAAQPQCDLQNPLVTQESDALSHHAGDVSWWSDEEVIVSRFSGAVSVCHIENMVNILGKKPEFFQGAPRVTMAHAGTFMVLECESNVLPSKRARSDDSVKMVQIEPDTEDTMLDLTRELFKSVMFAITDMETFQPRPRRVTVVARVYRLLGVRSTTPQELFSRKIESGNYSEALALAEEFALDSDLVYQQQWRKNTVSTDAIQKYLSKVSKKIWAVHQCVDRLPETLPAAKELLHFGLELTNEEILHEINKDREEKIEDPDSIELSDLNAYTTELLRCRHVMLFYRQRVSLYEAILRCEKSTYVKDEYDRLRANSLVHSSIELAKEGRIEALTCLWPHIKTVPMQLAVLESLPETINPMDYQHLLPVERNSEWMERSPVKLVDSDWCRKEIFRSIWSSNWSEDSTPDSETAAADDDISQWYDKRAREIEARSGLASHALTLATLAAEAGGVPGLDTLVFHLLTLDVLLYDLNVEGVTLEHLEKLSALETCGLLMKMSTPKTFVADLKQFVIPFLKRYETLTERADCVVQGLMDYLESVSVDDLSSILLVLQSPNEFELDVRTHLDLAEKCLYAYNGTEQLDKACDLLDTILKETDGSISESELIRRCAELEKLVAASSLINWRGVRVTVQELKEMVRDKDRARMLLARVARDNSLINWRGVRVTVQELKEMVRDKDRARMLLARRCAELEKLVAASSLINWRGVRVTVQELKEMVRDKDRARMLLARRCAELEKLVAASSLINWRGVRVTVQELKEMVRDKDRARMLLARVARDKNREEKWTQQEWEKLLKDLLELQSTLLTCVSKEEVYEIYASSLLTSGDEASMKLAAAVLSCGGAPPRLVPPARSAQLAAACAREYFNSSGELREPALQRAKCALSLIQDENEEIQKELDLIASLEILSAFNLDILPIQVRLCEDRLTLIEKCLQSDPNGYMASGKLLKLAKLLRVAGDDEQAREGLVLQRVAAAAIAAGSGGLAAATCAARRLAALRCAPAAPLLAHIARQARAHADTDARRDLYAAAATFADPKDIEQILRDRLSLELEGMQRTAAAVRDHASLADRAPSTDDEFADAITTPVIEKKDLVAPVEKKVPLFNYLLDTFQNKFSGGDTKSQPIDASDHSIYCQEFYRTLYPEFKTPHDYNYTAFSAPSPLEQSPAQAVLKWYYVQNCLDNCTPHLEGEGIHVHILLHPVRTQDAPSPLEQSPAQAVLKWYYVQNCLDNCTPHLEGEGIHVHILLHPVRTQDAPSPLEQSPAQAVLKWYYVQNCLDNCTPHLEGEGIHVHILLHPVRTQDAPSPLEQSPAQAVLKWYYVQNCLDNCTPHLEGEVVQKVASELVSKDTALSVACLLRCARDARLWQLRHSRAAVSAALYANVLECSAPELRDNVYLTKPKQLARMTLEGQNASDEQMEVIRRCLAKLSGCSEVDQIRALGLHVNGLLFSADPDYRQEIVYRLARSPNPEHLELACSLASKYDMDALEVWMQHAESDPTLSSLMSTLPCSDATTHTRIREGLWPKIIGSNHHALINFFTILKGVDEKPPLWGLTAAEHIKLLKKVKAASNELDYKILLEPASEAEFTSHILSVMRPETAGMVTKLLRTLPPACHLPLPVHTLYTMWLTNYFFSEPSNGSSSNKKWMQRYRQCASYFNKLAKKELLRFLADTCFSEQALQTVPAGTRGLMLMQAVDYCQQEQENDFKFTKDEMSWTQVGQELTRWARFLENYHSDTIQGIIEHSCVPRDEIWPEIEQSHGDPTTLVPLVGRLVLAGMGSAPLGTVLQCLHIATDAAGVLRHLADTSGPSEVPTLVTRVIQYHKEGVKLSQELIETMMQKATEAGLPPYKLIGLLALSDRGQMEDPGDMAKVAQYTVDLIKTEFSDEEYAQQLTALSDRGPMEDPGDMAKVAQYTVDLIKTEFSDEEYAQQLTALSDRGQMEDPGDMAKVAQYTVDLIKTEFSDEEYAQQLTALSDRGQMEDPGDMAKVAQYTVDLIKTEFSDEEYKATVGLPPYKLIGLLALSDRGQMEDPGDMAKVAQYTVDLIKTEFSDEEYAQQLTEDMLMTDDGRREAFNQLLELAETFARKKALVDVVNCWPPSRDSESRSIQFLYIQHLLSDCEQREPRVVIKLLLRRPVLTQQEVKWLTSNVSGLSIVSSLWVVVLAKCDRDQLLWLALKHKNYLTDMEIEDDLIKELLDNDYFIMIVPTPLYSSAINYIVGSESTEQNAGVYSIQWAVSELCKHDYVAEAGQLQLMAMGVPAALRGFTQSVLYCRNLFKK
ncbi:NBAS subunit of NRZ tethering complex-like [Cydia amplana]|uniref:NBAS subunit of NRZ tethering complex-like n=1 Tax=Cydia amplana TaxID=1869771 RepID=UPI002FE5573F